MKLKLRAILCYLLVAPFIIFSACKQGTTDTVQVDEKLQKEEIKSDIEEIVYPLPSPFELSEKLEDIGASYMPGILNAPGNIDQYFTENSKALALGVYGADLSYVGTYNQMQEIQVYSKVVRDLINQLGISFPYLNVLTEEDRNRLENKDTLVNFVTNAFYDTYTFLNEKSDPSLAALMVAGIWIEGLYISTHISEDTFNNYEMVKIIFDQSKSLEKVIELLDNFEGKQRIDTLSTALKKLKSIYDEAGDSLNKEQLQRITSTIAIIRESIVF